MMIEIDANPTLVEISTKKKSKRSLRKKNRRCWKKWKKKLLVCQIIFNVLIQIGIILTIILIIGQQQQQHISALETSTIKSQTTKISANVKAIAFEFQAFTKLLIVGGHDAQNYISNVEVIDYNEPNNLCSNLPDLPYPAEGPFGGLDYNGEPFVCGGRGNWRFCFEFDGGIWKPKKPLEKSRCNGASISGSPFKNSSNMIYTLGGYSFEEDGSTNTAIELTPSGWTSVLPSLPVRIYFHCMVSINETSVLVIGGSQNDITSAKTYLLVQKEDESVWVDGPPLITQRQEHGCGRIPTNLSDASISIIAAGGWSGNKGTALASSEIIDAYLSTDWTVGPSLPTVNGRFAVIEDPNGALLVISGTYKPSNMNSIYRLKSLDSQWELLPQKLRTPRMSPLVFFVPDHVVNCTLQ